LSLQKKKEGGVNKTKIEERRIERIKDTPSAPPETIFWEATEMSTLRTSVSWARSSALLELFFDSPSEIGQFHT